MVRFVIVVISLICAYYCSACIRKEKAANQIQCIDIEANMQNMKHVNLSHFTDNIRYVAMDIEDNFSFTGIWDCVFNDNFFIAKDLSKCVLYDYDGNIINRIGQQGNGPGEYRYVLNVSFGPSNKIYIQSLYDLLEYNLDGSFSKKYNRLFLINNDIIGTWMQMKDSLFFGKIQSSVGNEENKALLFDLHGTIICEYKNYILFERSRPVSGDTERHANIYYFNNQIVFKEMFNDTLFVLSDKYDLQPLYKINLGRYTIPVSFRKLFIVPENQYMVVNNVFQTSGYLFLDCNFGTHFPAKRLTPRIVWEGITSDFNTTNVLGIYDKQTKELIFSKPTSTDNPLFTSGLFNDIDAGPRFYPQKMVNDSTMVMWIEAKQLKDHVKSDDFKNNVSKYPEKKRKLEELAESLSEYDNPVLMFVTFKKGGFRRGL